MNVNPLTPITNLKICKNVPLDSSYKDTLTFVNVSDQINYFTGKTKYNFTNLTPIRLQNAIRVPINSDNLYDCNYIAFQNANFGNRWFYAFIKEIKFINVNMCEVNFELDVMQTWKFDYTVKPSFVEREHINNDAIGNNLIEENLETGEYIEMGLMYADATDMELIVVVATTFNDEGEWNRGKFYNGVYSGLQYFGFETESAINDFLESVNNLGKSDGIVSIFMMPKEFFGNVIAPIQKNISKNYETLKNGYVPKNNKLFTYPYNFLSVVNGNGENAIYRYEFFSQENCTFAYYGDTTPNPSVLLYPVGYKGSGAQNYEQGIIMGGFPQCAFNTDIFKAWLAQNASSLAVSSISSVTQAMVGGITANPVMATTGLTGITNILSQAYQHSVLPPQARGTGSNSSLNISLGRKNFIFYKITLQEEYLKIIDDYFSMFGYATKQVKIPNVTGRPSWNYVKTIDSKIVGSIPFDDIKKIREIFDSGITFWHGDFVGDYTRNNKGV